MLEESKQGRANPVYDSVNEQLTYESMFKVKDTTSGQEMDLRELLDLKESDFSNNEELMMALQYMNAKSPISME